MPSAPRSRREIREALRALGARPSRRRGQNFLVDGRVLERVVAAAGPRAGDLVLEVGSGLGGLTERLGAAGAEVVAVEIDPALAGFLRGLFAGTPRVRVVEADALDGRGGLSGELRAALAAAPHRGRLLCVANLPYSIATPLLLALLRLEPPPSHLVLMVQKEVAERIRAAPSTPAYGPLSVLVQSVARASTICVVPAVAFHPVPEVASAVLKIVPDGGLRNAIADRGRLTELIHAAFGMRRKTLGNALARAGRADAAALRAAGVDPARRAETLSPGEFVALAAALPSLASGAAGAETRRTSP